ncbi:hypothetical protein PR048_020289 [Dryococelus australis]|uniref:NADH dehydrogenase [ubiquinone] 1 beta subcomplex subunit 11, mitochondrial n=1 Tax=Dryococelus australis TaxID=614101 RepID=A0ABQ9H638_9NEOP|nr:hypothetical protein PR048_020289 [Dryococelus australis]
MAYLMRACTLGLRCRGTSPISSCSQRFISTSGKNNETAPVTAAEKVQTSVVEEKNWMSYGFDFKDRATDRNVMHSTFFTSVTLCLVFGTFIFMYAPDPALHNWAQREAFLELRRREQLGLPLIDRNLVDPAKIELPSEEVLVETEIVI